MRIIPFNDQAKGQFNGGQILEHKPIGFPQEGGPVKAYSNILYWAYAWAETDSTIGLHPHQGFEILSFILKGNIEHYDTKQRQWIPLSAGDVQVIQSRAGISHAEKMLEGSAMFQIWFDPDISTSLGKEPEYTDYKATEFSADDKGKTGLIGEDAPIVLDAEGLEVYRQTLSAGTHSLKADTGMINSIYMLYGNAKVSGELVNQGDFMITDAGEEISLDLEDEAEIFVISSPERPSSRTYAERRF